LFWTPLFYDAEYINHTMTTFLSTIN